MTSVTVAGDSETTSTTTFRQCDDEGAVFESGDGSHRVRWSDLQAHASFPFSQTTISQQTITTPLGTFECHLYEVTREGRVDRFWFAVDLPGMPIKQETVAGETVISTTTVVSNVT